MRASGFAIAAGEHDNDNCTQQLHAACEAIVPILEPETDIFPADLLAAQGQLQADRCWRVVHTRPRQEKALARELFAAEVPFYLPLIARRSKIRGRVVRSLVPLFSSYLFTCGDETHRLRTLQTDRVVHMLDVHNQPQLDHELRNMRRLIAADAPLSLERKLEAGRPVRIKNGPMEGTEGVVISRKGKEVLLVAVTLLQQGVSLEIEDFQVEPIY